MHIFENCYNCGCQLPRTHFFIAQVVRLMSTSNHLFQVSKPTGAKLNVIYLEFLFSAIIGIFSLSQNRAIFNNVEHVCNCTSGGANSLQEQAGLLKINYSYIN